MRVRQTPHEPSRFRGGFEIASFGVGSPTSQSSIQGSSTLVAWRTSQRSSSRRWPGRNEDPSRRQRASSRNTWRPWHWPQTSAARSGARHPACPRARSIRTPPSRRGHDPGCNRTPLTSAIGVCARPASSVNVIPKSRGSHSAKSAYSPAVAMSTWKRFSAAPARSTRTGTPGTNRALLATTSTSRSITRVAASRSRSRIGPSLGSSSTPKGSSSSRYPGSPSARSPGWRRRTPRRAER